MVAMVVLDMFLIMLLLSCAPQLSLSSLNYYFPCVSHLCPPLMYLNLILLFPLFKTVFCIGSSVSILSCSSCFWIIDLIFLFVVWICFSVCTAWCSNLDKLNISHMFLRNDEETRNYLMIICEEPKGRLGLINKHDNLHVKERSLTPLQMETASLDRDLGYDTLCSIIDWNNSSSSSPSNGGWVYRDRGKVE